MKEKEQYYIDKYDSWHDGYNNGPADTWTGGENNFKAKMSEKEIEDIRVRQSKMTETRKDIFKDYEDKITWTNFSFICKYITWPGVRPDLNTPEIMNWHDKRIGNEVRKMSEEELMEIWYLRNIERCIFAEIARRTGKHRQQISRICKGVYYKKESDKLRETHPELFPQN